MRKLIIGNKSYSSWSMRGWLACKLSELPFEEQVVPMFTPAWDAARAGPLLAPSGGQVPVLWEADLCVWDSLAIITHLAEAVGADKFWPAERDARAYAQCLVAEMHSSYAALRQDCGMNLRRVYEAGAISDSVAWDVARITALWESARSNYGAGGDFLFGAFGAADIMFAPVVTRFHTYALPATPTVQAYIDAVRAHPHMREWQAAADAEDWVIDKYER